MALDIAFHGVLQ